MHTTNTAAATHKFLILNIGTHYFGVPITSIQDVIQRNPVTSVPLAPSNVLGLMNLRGYIVTEIDVARTLAIAGPPMALDAGYAIVINKDGELYSFVFENIGDVIEIAPDAIEKLPFTIDKDWMSLSSGVHRHQDRLIVLLNFDSILEQLTKTAHHAA